MKNSYPQRIVCLTEETTEWLYLLGEARRVVGVSAYTVRPEEAREKPRVSAFITGNIKKIKALNPDLVVGFSDIQAELAAKLIKEGLNVLVTNQRSLAEIENTLRLIAKIVGQEEKASQLLHHWQKKIKKLAKSAKKRKPLKVFFQEWDEPIISGITWVSELIAICGGVDVFRHKAQAMAKDRVVSLAEVTAAKPEVILASWCGKPMNRQWIEQNFANTPAVQNGQIYEIEASVILQPGPALFLEGVDRLYEVLEKARGVL